MKVLSIFISCYIFLTSGKLVERNTEKNYDTKPTEYHSALRISRQAFYDEGIGLSIEDYHRNYVRKERYSIKDNKYSDEIFPKSVRVYRDSAEKRTETKKTTETTVKSKPKVLIKKPIPKFNAVDDEDFQIKVSALPTKVADSGEHEDEDFNLDDYEFDVNHDEFVGRGKPLEPRRKYKGNRQSTQTPKKNPTTTHMPEIKIQSKVVIPASPSSNVKRNVHNKAADKMKEDYYDDITTTKLPETTAKEQDDDFSDESDSREYNQKASIRTIRSPWNVRKLADKMGGNGAKIMSNVLANLPLFPEPPNSNEDKIVDVANLDPITGKEFMF